MEVAQVAHEQTPSFPRLVERLATVRSTCEPLLEVAGEGSDAEGGDPGVGVRGEPVARSAPRGPISAVASMRSNGTAAAASRCLAGRGRGPGRRRPPRRNPSGGRARCRSSGPGCPCRRCRGRRSGDCGPAAPPGRRRRRREPLRTTSNPAIGSPPTPAPADTRPARTASIWSAAVLGREEDGEPAVGDLAGELEVLRPDRGEVDGQVGARRVIVSAQRLPRAVGQRQREVLSGIRDLLAPQRHADDLDVLPRAGERGGEAHAVPALADLRAGDTEPEAEASFRRGCRAWPRSSPSWPACAPGSA